jgi:CBS-domain-containing membrane protein
MNIQNQLKMKNLLHRQQARQSIKLNIKSGMGGLLSIAAIAWLSILTDSLLLMAPFGATCVLLFSVPNSPLSQPINVIGGHLISTTIGILLLQFLAVEWWSLGLAVGLSITMMSALRVTHPPAGADPLVVFFGGFGWEYLIFPVVSGSLLLILLAWAFHKLPPNAEYPLYKSK